MSSSGGSVTHWLAQLNAGNPDAAQELWNRYFHRVVGLARKKLRGLPSPIADEEDVALSAFKSFFRRAEEGKFPELADSDGLWPLLVKITANKAYNLQRDQRRVKRGGGKLVHVGALPSEDDLVAVVGAEPSPAFAEDLIEELRHLVRFLPDAETKQVALLKLEGKATAEIAAELGLNERRVQRRLKVVLELWREKLSESKQPPARLDPKLRSAQEGTFMRCPICRHENPAGRDKCGKCHNPLRAAPAPAGCPHCGADMPPKAMFCGKCGKRMQTTAEVPPAPPTRFPAEAPAPAAPPPPTPTPPVAVQAPTPAPVLPAAGAADFTPGPSLRDERREAKAEPISPNGSLRPMVLIPDGEFLMGSPEGTGRDEERPQHKVRLRAYYIDRHAVSNIEYERFDPAHKQQRPELSDGDDDPVVMVNHQDALKYCRWRAEQEKVPLETYTLPTEAQWERAARGGFPDRLYPWGDSINIDLCNTAETGRRRAVAVGVGIPNGFLLYHMGGNVREWCLDCYSRTYYGQTVPLCIDPQGPAPNPMENFRVVRGASFIESAVALGRCAARGFAAPRSKNSDVGFRCVRLVSLR